MPPLVSSTLSPKELVTVVRANLEYADEDDAPTALVMARTLRSAIKQLSLVRPTEATAGGTGKGAGYSAVWDDAWLKNELKQVEAFITTRSRSSVLDHFGYRGADTRNLQDPAYAGRDG